ncbi:MAG TPA: alkaline phosphatase, partial [Opitutales bacterium]|nr:alkaline phosphatase [Opitutales bacterium]
AEDHGLATGLVSTSAITHATPAAFIAHNESRYNYEEIATDFLKTDIDVFIGGGLDHFEKRSDGRDLVAELEQKGYQIVRSQEAFTQVESGKLAALTNPLHTERIRERGKYLEAATRTALAILDNDPEGFFLMVEGSLVDFGGHAASTIYVVEETLDFDRAVGVALEFAAQNKETLVIVTADHETGGMAVLNGDESTGRVEASFATHAHTGLLVPLMVFGPGSSAFTGFIDNTELNQLMRAALFGKD